MRKRTSADAVGSRRESGWARDGADDTIRGMTSAKGRPVWRRIAAVACWLGAGGIAAGQKTAGSAAAPNPAASGKDEMVTLDTGARLHIVRIGTGGQVVVVPMGSWLAESFRGLASPGRTLVLYDTRGRGLSDPVDPAKVSFANELADLDALRRHLGVGKIALVGWSHYGLMTAVYAIRNPERVSRLIQMTPASPRKDPYLAEGMETARSRVSPEEYQQFETKKKSGGFAGDPVAECRAFLHFLRPAYFGDRSAMERMTFDECAREQERPDNVQKFFQALFASMGNWDWRREARSLSVPRLVVHGEKDFIPLAGSREWVAGNPNARLLVLPGVGHHPFVERPDLFFPAADRFLNGAWPEGAVAVPADAGSQAP